MPHMTEKDRVLRLFPWGLLTHTDFTTAQRYIGGSSKFLPRSPDLIIAPDGAPYIYRWHLVERNTQANVYFHIQVSDDPERPLHDHPWDCTSVILAGGYREVYDDSIMPYEQGGNGRFMAKQERVLRPGQTVHRKAEMAHRLFLDGRPYSMSLFTTGPKVREWGFWCPTQATAARYCRWHNQAELIENTPDGRSIFKEPNQ